MNWELFLFLDWVFCKFRGLVIESFFGWTVLFLSENSFTSWLNSANVLNTVIPLPLLQLEGLKIQTFLWERSVHAGILLEIGLLLGKILQNSISLVVLFSYSLGLTLLRWI